MVAVFEEGAFAAIAAPGYMMGNARKDEARKAGHDELPTRNADALNFGIVGRVTVIRAPDYCPLI